MELKPGDKIFVLPNKIMAPEGLNTVFDVFYEQNRVIYFIDNSPWAWTAYLEYVLKIDDLSKLEKIIYGIE